MADSEAHSICDYCVPVYSKYGTIFTGTVMQTTCCFCGHANETGQMMHLNPADDGVYQRPWWCGDKLGIHRNNGTRVAVVR